MVFGLGNRRAKLVAELNAASEVVETARGPVEFARHGDPPYVLILHGTPQGHNASFIGEPFEAAGFGTITPSRPGYLRTPLETGRTFEEQADAAAALLDALSIDQVAAYAVSGGGPTGIEFAARHPDRVKALILEAALSQTHRPASSLAPAYFLFLVRIVSWVQAQMMRFPPDLWVDFFVDFESVLDRLDHADCARVTAEILASPEKIAFLSTMVATTPPVNLLRAGFENDLEQFQAIEQLPMARVSCPTLVAHGTHDREVPFSHAEASAQGIPGAELFQVEKGWRLLALSDGDNAYLDREIEFLREHLAG